MQNIIGVRREDKNIWERRTPIIPEHARILREQYYITIYAQPSENRIFTDEEYRSAGVVISDDLYPCDIIFGVKEMPVSFFEKKKTYIFFSHTVKGQKYNMPMLRRIMDVGATLIDYEKIVDDQGNRRIFFGPYAGMAGMTDALWTLGKRLEYEGYRGYEENPFSLMQQACTYNDLEDIEKTLKELGEYISEKGLPDSLVPFVVGISGYGHVSRGARRILNSLPFIKIKPGELGELRNGSDISKHHIYRVVFEEKDMVELKEPDTDTEFDVQDYYQNPGKYRGIFSRYLPDLTVMVNAIYWDERYPRLITPENTLELWQSGNRKLKIIADLSCDVRGAVGINTKVMNPGNPVYVYNPESGMSKDGFEGEGYVVLAVDNLPAEVPRPASVDFSKSLMLLIPDLASCDFNQSFKNLQVSEIIKRAIIVHRGALTPNYQYLKDHLK
jgi:saccharopine dehydrogenase (NAD+, L-lysine forming)